MCIIFPDYTRPISVSGSSWTATEDCFMSFNYIANNAVTSILSINNISVSAVDRGASWGSAHSWCGFIKKGDVCVKTSGVWKFFSLRTE